MHVEFPLGCGLLVASCACKQGLFLEQLAGPADQEVSHRIAEERKEVGTQSLGTHRTRLAHISTATFQQPQTEDRWALWAEKLDRKQGQAANQISTKQRPAVGYSSTQRDELKGGKKRAERRSGNGGGRETKVSKEEGSGLAEEKKRRGSATVHECTVHK